MDLLDADDDAQEPEEELFEVWPENAPAVELFLDVSTQWYTTVTIAGVAGMVGAFDSRIVRTGLNYGGVESMLRMRRVPVKKHSGLLCDLQVMERAALDEMRNQRDADTAQ